MNKYLRWINLQVVYKHKYITDINSENPTGILL